MRLGECRRLARGNTINVETLRNTHSLATECSSHSANLGLCMKIPHSTFDGHLGCFKFFGTANTNWTCLLLHAVKNLFRLST